LILCNYCFEEETKKKAGEERTLAEDLLVHTVFPGVSRVHSAILPSRQSEKDEKK
jgi:hypothetical protein